MGFFNWRRHYAVHTYRIDSMFYLIRAYADNSWHLHCGNAWEGWRELQFNLG
jgi:hypothetical protein